MLSNNNLFLVNLPSCPEQLIERGPPKFDVFPLGSFLTFPCVDLVLVSLVIPSTDLPEFLSVFFSVLAFLSVHLVFIELSVCTSFCLDFFQTVKFPKFWDHGQKKQETEAKKDHE